MYEINKDSILDICNTFSLSMQKLNADQNIIADYMHSALFQKVNFIALLYKIGMAK